ncbi:MAG: myxosortase family intramembrane protease [Deltaproteobacteria bacterium]
MAGSSSPRPTINQQARWGSSTSAGQSATRFRPLRWSSAWRPSSRPWCFPSTRSASTGGTNQPEIFRWCSLPNIASFVVAQLIVIALPEEAFFRGYLQTSLSDLSNRRVRVLGVELAPGAWLLQAALFAVIHFLVDPHPARLAVFFPALLFGWTRAWRGGIGAALALHAMSNLYSEILARSWL